MHGMCAYGDQATTLVMSRVAAGQRLVAGWSGNRCMRYDSLGCVQVSFEGGQGSLECI